MSGSASFPYRVEHTNPFVTQLLSDQLHQALHLFSPMKEIALVCIGTDRSTGDSLGPLVGTLLEKNATQGIQIYGTLDRPVHAMNLKDTLDHIQLSSPDALVIGIDACLGQLKNVGFLQVGLGPVRPGAGVNKQLPEVGQIHITGTVNVSGFMEYLVLQNTRLSIVMKMAEAIATSITRALRRLENQMSVVH